MLQKVAHLLCINKMQSVYKVVHACDPSTQKEGAGISRGSRLALATILASAKTPCLIEQGREWLREIPPHRCAHSCTNSQTRTTHMRGKISQLCPHAPVMPAWGGRDRQVVWGLTGQPSLPGRPWTTLSPLLHGSMLPSSRATCWVW